MKIQPILPLGALLAGFGFIFLLTAYCIISNKLKTVEKIFSLLRISFVYVLVLLIGLRPVMVETNYEFATKNLDVLFVVDTTISMWAEDYSGKKTRMSGVQKDVSYVINELAGSNFGLVTFDDTPHVLSPYTQDAQYIKDLIDTFETLDDYYAQGSDLSIPYHDIEALLKSSAKKENRKTIVFYISDGEITSGKELTDYSEFAQYIDSGAVMGYGSASGGRMKRDGGYGYVYDYDTHKDAVSRIDEDNLKKIAEDMDISYINLNDGNSALMGTVQLIKESSKTIIENGEGAEVYTDIYYFFAFPLALMLFIEMFMIIRKGRF